MNKLLKQTLDAVLVVKKIPYQVYIVLFLVFGASAIIALRNNNQNMITLRNNLYTADQNNGDVEGALDKLRFYVYAHMNTDLSSGGNAIKPPLQLKYTYERLQSQAQAAANNSSLYTEAENVCQEQIPASVSISGRGRISCVQDYILNHGGKQALTVPVALYQFDFISPVWSPDTAGWSLLASAFFFVAFAASFLVKRFN